VKWGRSRRSSGIALARGPISQTAAQLANACDRRVASRIVQHEPHSRHDEAGLQRHFT
jgi:hypothetical protein